MPTTAYDSVETTPRDLFLPRPDVMCSSTARLALARGQYLFLIDSCSKIDSTRRPGLLPRRRGPSGAVDNKTISLYVCATFTR
jgi:hypothetical protein